MIQTRIYIVCFLFAFLWRCTPKADEVVGPAVPGQPAVAADFRVPDTGLFPLENERSLDALLQDLGGAGLVFLGEGSQGSADYYTWRAALTRRLVEEKGFKVIAIEGDWPASFAVHQFITGDKRFPSAQQALASFSRWPAWRWANHDMANFVSWLRDYNARLPGDQQVAFRGLDVYSLWESLESLQQQLPPADAPTREALTQALDCLKPYNRNTATYAQATKGGGGCGPALEKLYAAIQNQLPNLAGEQALQASQLALTALNAHKYYQATLLSNLQAWNWREQHMIATIDRLLQHHGPQAKIIVWAHNSHTGDARFSHMSQEGLLSLGQLAKEKFKAQGVYLVGFGAYQGQVIAAGQWGGPGTEMVLPPALPGSWEAAMHEHSSRNKGVLLREWRKNLTLTKLRGHRSLGAVYDPKQETGSYGPSNLPNRYDAYLYLERTQALRPLSGFAGSLRQETGGFR
ncbi:MAG: erythromycin esterase family protein [Adhaeribacter sp.]